MKDLYLLNTDEINEDDGVAVYHPVEINRAKAVKTVQTTTVYITAYPHHTDEIDVIGECWHDGDNKLRVRLYG